MMRISDKIVWIALFGLLCLPVFRLFSVSWQDILILLVLTLGLLYMSVKTTKDSFPSFSAYLPVLLAALFMFVIIQFDPATSAVHTLVQRNQSRWFFLFSSGLILMAGIAVLVRGVLQTKVLRSKKKKLRHSITLFDKIAILVCAGSIALSLISQSIFKIAPQGWRDYIGELKIIECLVLWFAITRTASNRGEFPPDASQSQRKVPPVLRWQLRIACLIFLIISIGGGVRTVLVYNSFRLGSALYQQDEFESAKRKYRQAQHLNRCLHIKPVQDGCTDKLAVIYLRQDSTAKAETLLNGIEGSGEDSGSISRRLGDVYFEAGKWAAARRAYRKGLRREKTREHLLNRIVWCYINLDDIHGLSRFVSSHEYPFHVNPTDAQSANLIGRYFLMNGINDNALRSFQKAKQFNPNNFENYFWIGQTLHILEQWSESLGFLKKAIEMKPDFGEAYHLLASAYEMMGQPNEAVAWYQTCIEHQPTHSNALIALEQYYVNKGMIHRAHEFQRREHVVYSSEMMGARHPFSTEKVLLRSNFKVAKMCRLIGGEVVFNIIAKATSHFQVQPDEIPNFDPSALMVVWLDDVVIGKTDVPLGEWTTHSFVIDVTTGIHNLIIEFTNDIHRPAEKMDRNLAIDRVIIQNERYE